jgi:hypothetical protein
MPYRDPDQQRAHQREIQRDRSRGVAIYRAALLWCAKRHTEDGKRHTEDGRKLLVRLTRMLTAELAWRREHNIRLPRWPVQREEELLGSPLSSAEREFLQSLSGDVEREIELEVEGEEGAR